MAIFLIGCLILSPLPILAMLGGVHLVRTRFLVIPPAEARRSRKGRIFKSTPQAVANSNQRSATRRAA